MSAEFTPSVGFVFGGEVLMRVPVWPSKNVGK